jgi:hypothetical protein
VLLEKNLSVRFFYPPLKTGYYAHFFKQEEQSDEIYGVPPFSKLYDVQNL